jgi:hypothetical protein
MIHDMFVTHPEAGSPPDRSRGDPTGALPTNWGSQSAAIHLQGGALRKESPTMAVIAHVVLRGVTPEQYDAVRAEANWLGEAPDGGISHVTWWEGADCHNLDAWESEAAFGAFGENRLGPAMAKVGIQSEPEASFHPAHEVFLPRAVTITAT